MIKEAIKVRLSGNAFKVIDPGHARLLGMSFEACDFPEDTPDGVYQISAESSWNGKILKSVKFFIPSYLKAV